MPLLPRGRGTGRRSSSTRRPTWRRTWRRPPHAACGSSACSTRTSMPITSPARASWRDDANAVLHLSAAALARGVRYAAEVVPVRDGDDLTLGDASVRVVALPGHTSDMTGLMIGDGALIGGDSLFADGVARPDLENGDEGASVGRASAAPHAARAGCGAAGGHAAAAVPLPRRPARRGARAAASRGARPRCRSSPWTRTRSSSRCCRRCRPGRRTTCRSSA